MTVQRIAGGSVMKQDDEYQSRPIVNTCHCLPYYEPKTKKEQNGTQQCDDSKSSNNKLFPRADWVIQSHVKKCHLTLFMRRWFVY